MPADLLVRVVPLLFVLIWSTGWIVARWAAPHADPLTFLAVRYALAALLIAPVALLARVPWPRGRQAGHALVSGVLLHALYLGGVWWAIKHGLPAGVSGLVAALQPLMTAALAPRLAGERVGALAWTGIAVGLSGVGLVLAPKLVEGLGGLPLLPLAVNVLAMLSVTLGTFHQKRCLASGDLRAIAALQYVGALLATVPLALLLEEGRLDPVRETYEALAWSVLVLSIGAIGLLLLMIRRGAVSRVASLLHLVAPTVAIQAYLLFGEALSPVQLAGVVVAALGVALATRGAPAPAAEAAKAGP